MLELHPLLDKELDLLVELLAAALPLIRVHCQEFVGDCDLLSDFLLWEVLRGRGGSGRGDFRFDVGVILFKSQLPEILLRQVL